MKVLVTGATGNLGRAACEAFKAAGIDFLATDARADRELPYRVKVANLLEREACYGLLDGCDAVVHLANHPNEHAATAQRVYAENAAMNINIFQAALELGLRRVIYASSIQAINGGRTGNQENLPSRLKYLPLDGDTPAQPANPYAVSKVSAELVLKYMVEQQKLESAVAVRFPAMIWPQWFEHVRREFSRPQRRGFLDEAFAWLSFHDAATLLVATARASFTGYRCYLPANPAPLPNAPIPAIVQKFFATVPLRRPVEELKSLVDISAITAETGWAPQEHFDAATA